MKRKHRRMTKKECQLAWAAALGLLIISPAARKLSATEISQLYNESVSGETYTITIDTTSTDKYIEQSGRYAGIGAEAYSDEDGNEVQPTVTVTATGSISISGDASATRLYGLAANYGTLSVTSDSLKISLSDSSGAGELRAVRANYGGNITVIGDTEIELTSTSTSATYAIGVDNWGDGITFNDAVNIAITSDYAEIRGIQNYTSASEVKFTGDFTLTSTAGEYNAAEHRGLVAYKSTTSFNGSTTSFTLTDNSTSEGSVRIINAESNANDNTDTIVNFASASTTLSASSVYKDIYAVYSSGGCSYLNFTGGSEETGGTVTVSASSTGGVAVGLLTQYGGTITGGDYTDFYVTVSSETYASGVEAADYNGSVGAVSLGGDLTVQAETTTGYAIGISVSSESEESSASVSVGGDTVVTSNATGEGGRAYGIYAEGSASATLSGDVSVTATASGDDGTSYGIVALDGASVAVGSDSSKSVSVTADAAVYAASSSTVTVSAENVSLTGDVYVKDSSASIYADYFSMDGDIYVIDTDSEDSSTATLTIEAETLVLSDDAGLYLSDGILNITTDSNLYFSYVYLTSDAVLNISTTGIISSGQIYVEDGTFELSFDPLTIDDPDLTLEIEGSGRYALIGASSADLTIVSDSTVSLSSTVTSEDSNVSRIYGIDAYGKSSENTASITITAGTKAYDAVYDSGDGTGSGYDISIELTNSSDNVQVRGIRANYFGSVEINGDLYEKLENSGSGSSSTVVGIDNWGYSITVNGNTYIGLTNSGSVSSTLGVQVEDDKTDDYTSYVTFTGEFILESSVSEDNTSVHKGVFVNRGNVTFADDASITLTDKGNSTDYAVYAVSLESTRYDKIASEVTFAGVTTSLTVEAADKVAYGVYAGGTKSSVSFTGSGEDLDGTVSVSVSSNSSAAGLYTRYGASITGAENTDFTIDVTSKGASAVGLYATSESDNTTKDDEGNVSDVYAGTISLQGDVVINVAAYSDAYGIQSHQDYTGSGFDGGSITIGGDADVEVTSTNGSAYGILSDGTNAKTTVNGSLTITASSSSDSGLSYGIAAVDSGSVEIAASSGEDASGTSTTIDVSISADAALVALEGGTLTIGTSDNPAGTVTLDGGVEANDGGTISVTASKIILDGDSTAPVYVYSDDAVGTEDGSSITFTGVVLGAYSDSDDTSETVSGSHVYLAAYDSETQTDSGVYISNTTINGSVYGGYSVNGTASDNTVTMSDSSDSVSGYLIGGYSVSGSAESNAVNVSGGSVSRVYGGDSYSGTASENKVSITGGEVTVFAIGGYSYSSEASSNKIEISGGTVSYAYGGYSNADTVSENEVVIKGGDVSGYAIGGYAYNGEVTGNSVTISSSISGWIAGGYSYLSDSTQNEVALSGSESTAVSTGYIYGGRSVTGSASGNTVTAEYGYVSADVIGGYSYYGATDSNTVTLTDTTVTNDVCGGYNYFSTSSESTASGNTITAIDSTIGAHVIGGLAAAGAASENIVTLSGTDVTYDVVGGWALIADGNTVSISDGVIGRDVYGGASIPGDSTSTASDNTVSLTGNSSVGGNLTGGDAVDGEASSNTVYIGLSAPSDESDDSETSSSTKSRASAVSVLSTDDEETAVSASVTGNVIGGYSEYASADSNTVVIDTESTSDSITLSGNVYGGYSNASEVTYDSDGNAEITASANYVYIGTSEDDTKDTTGTIIISGSVYGGYANAGDADSNTVTVSGSTISYLYGGYSSGSSASNNTVTVTSSSAKTTYGGYAAGSAGDANGNTVTITESTIEVSTSEGSVFGGRSYGGSADSNETKVTDSTVASSIYGGYSELYSDTETGTASASSNTVTVEGTTTAASVFGGHSLGGSADGNRVDVNGGAYGYIIGGMSWTGGWDYSNTWGTADENTVNITPDESSAVTASAHVSGGFAAFGSSASKNTVEINDGAFSAAVSGGILFYGETVSENTVTVNSGTIYGADVSGYGIQFFDHVGVVGGGLGSTTSSDASVTDNSVVINGGTIEGDVLGGYLLYNTSEVSGNSVVITGGQITGAVYGGRADYNSSTVTGNTVTITGGTLTSGTVSIAQVSLDTDDILNFNTSEYTLYSNVYGGYAETGNAEGNYVYIGTTADEISKDSVSDSASSDSITIGNDSKGIFVAGGWSESSSATGNAVYVNGGSIYGTIVGGVSEGSGDVSGNAVIVYDAEVINKISGTTYISVMGGYSSDTGTGSVTDNSVTVSDGSFGSVYAAYIANSDSSGTVSGNTAVINGGTYSTTIRGGVSNGSGDVTENGVTITAGTISSSVYGGHSLGSGDVTKNYVIISEDDGDVTVGSNVFGGFSKGSGDVSENTVTISAGEYSYAVFAGYSTGSGAVTGNVITISGGTFENGVCGGLSAGSGSVTGNSAVISNAEISSSVYGGKSNSGEASGNSVYLKGEAVIGGTVYGGYSTSGTVSDNALYVSETENSALTLSNFATVDFDIADREDGDVMLYLTSGSVTDLTGSEISVSSGDDGTSAEDVAVSVTVTPGGTLYLIDSTGGITVSAENISSIDLTGSYTLGEDYVEDDASLSGTYDVDIMVLSYGTDSDGNTSVTELTGDNADDDGTISGDDLVIRAGSTIYVTDVDLDMTSDAELEWGNSTRLTLEPDLTYVFSSDTSVAGFATSDGDEITLTITGDSIEGTLLAAEDYTLLLDGSNTSTTVKDLDSLSTDDLTASYTYAPASGVTVTGSLGVDKTDENGDDTDDSLALSVTGIDSITFETISFSEDTLVTLASSKEYDFTDTSIDVSSLVLQDYNETTVDGDTYVMTLIDADDNAEWSDELGTLLAENTSFGYELIGTDDAGYENGSVLSGTLTGSVSVEDDDLVLKTGTEVSVTGISFDISELTWGDENSVQLTLNTSLSYTFDSDVSVTNTSDTITITGISDALLEAGESSLILDGSSSTVEGLDDVPLSDISLGYTYEPADGVMVAGEAEVVTEDSDSDGESDSLALSVSSINSITFDISYAGDDAMLDLTESASEHLDLSETEILTENADSAQLDPGDEITLIATTYGLTVGDITQPDLSLDYSLDDDYVNCDSSLSGTYALSITTSDTDLVLQAGTDITVSDVTLDTSELEWNGDALITLESSLSYDFSGISSSDSDTFSAAEETSITTASFLDVDSVTVLIDGSSSAVSGMDGLEGAASTYSYSLLDGAVEVTGTAETSLNGSTDSLYYKISSIDTLDFYITSETSTDSAMISVESANLSGTAISAYAKGGSYLTEGYSVTLIDTENGITTDDETTYYGTVTEGASVEYELEVASDGDKLTATIGSASLREGTKSLVETRLGQASMIEQGQDHISHVLDSGTSLIGGSTAWVPFVTMSASSLSYDTGSSVDIDGFNSAVGVLRNFDTENGRMTVGASFQYGRGEYDSYANGVDAEGDTDYVGGLVMARHRWNSGFYLEGSVSAGYSQADYGTSSLLEGTVTTYDVGSTYWGMHVGLGREYDLSGGKTLNVYGRYFYSHLSSSRATLSSGEDYKFGGVDSSRVRIGARFSRNVWDNGGYYFGAAYQYQFRDDARAVYNGMSTATPGLQGSSGMLEAGIKVTPKSTQNLTVDLGVSGWAGKQKGVEGSLKLKWDI